MRFAVPKECDLREHDVARAPTASTGQVSNALQIVHGKSVFLRNTGK